MLDNFYVDVQKASRATGELSEAEEIVAKEKIMTAAVRRGDPVSKVMGADYEMMLKQNGCD